MTIHKKNKTIIGQIENIKVKEFEIDFLARIDTGAATTSIHAKNIKIIDNDEEHEDIRKHLGDRVLFTVVNEKGDEATHDAEIVKIIRIRNAQGVERRFIVKLTLVLNGKEKTVKVNLRNRDKLEYKLLIGRNWLNGDYLVDVEK